jgi:hypothetical protein
MASVSACLPAPPLTEWLFRRRLETIHDRLLELEGCCPPGMPTTWTPCSTCSRPR